MFTRSLVLVTIKTDPNTSVMVLFTLEKIHKKVIASDSGPHSH